jgi:hypothetical protein
VAVYCPHSEVALRPLWPVGGRRNAVTAVFYVAFQVMYFVLLAHIADVFFAFGRRPKAQKSVLCAFGRAQKHSALCFLNIVKSMVPGRPWFCSNSLLASKKKKKTKNSIVF